MLASGQGCDGWLKCSAASTAARYGWVAEWFKALVLKTSVRGTVPWVRIPPHPPLAPAKAFSLSGYGRIFALFSRVMREGLSTCPCARWAGTRERLRHSARSHAKKNTPAEKLQHNRADLPCRQQVARRVGAHPFAQISMSTIQVIAFRRNQLRRVREAFPEIERPGVYLLIGTDENDPDRLIAYIGESEGIGARLYTHNSSDAGRDPKGFWTDTVVLISKDENLTKSHARYVEACLIRAVESNPRWLVPNSKRPSEDAGELPLPNRAAIEDL